MQLYLDSFGAYLAVQNGGFLVRLRGGSEPRFFAVREIGAILMTRGTALSADAALLAADAGIPLLLIDANTHFPLAQLGSGRPGSIATIRKNQLGFSRSAAGFEWVARRLAQKAARQREHLRRTTEEGWVSPETAADLALSDRLLAAQERIFAQWKPAPVPWTAAVQEQTAQTFRGQEGTASRIYFQALGKCLAGKTAFTGRQQRPAYEPFNALLNYLYGMLYTSVQVALLKNGLDPQIGVLHADQYGDAPTLAFDAIEPYRSWADGVALRLFLSGAVQDAMFVPAPENQAGGGLWIGAAGKSIVLDTMLDFLNQPEYYNGKNVRRSVQIDLEARQLALFLKEMDW
jgi:CRISP-associated protein Cas1